MNRPGDDLPNGSVPDSESASALADRRLKRAVREVSTASMAPGGADVEALQARVLAQWRQAHAGGRRPATATAGATAGGSAAAESRTAASVIPLGSIQRRRRLWAGAAGLAAVVALTTAVIVRRPDPALEELMQPDVLSQLAIGEM